MNLPTKPLFKLPPFACDAHCHVFGPARDFPYAPNRRYTPQDAGKADLFALHEYLGLERAVIVQASCHGTDNRAMLDAIAARPQALRGVCVMDETFSEKDIEKLHQGGVRGVRFNFVKHLGGAPDLRVFHTVLARVKAFNWHVVLHLDAVDIESLTPLIASLELPFVIDHMGRVKAELGVEQPAFKALLELFKRDNAWVKVSGAERIAFPPYDKATPFARALIKANKARVLWGTDFPHPNSTHAADEGALVDLLRDFGDDEELQYLLVKNPAELYGFN